MVQVVTHVLYMDSFKIQNLNKAEPRKYFSDAPLSVSWPISSLSFLLGEVNHVRYPDLHLKLCCMSQSVLFFYMGTLIAKWKIFHQMLWVQQIAKVYMDSF